MMKFAIACLAASVSADWQPCGPSSSACCNPTLSPAQFCPGDIPCQSCGGSAACACPSGPTPAPPGPPGPSGPQRLSIVNGCSSAPVWIAHIATNQVGPDPQDVKIEPLERKSFTTSQGGGGLIATRYWPKMGCDQRGNNCAIGDSGGPGEGCVIRVPGQPDDYSHCAPPIDSKFEATFMAPGSAAMDTLDMSLVDGFSLPFKLEVSGGHCIRVGQPFQTMDCSGLSMNDCPSDERINGNIVDLHARHPKTGKVAGCFSPCMKLTDDKWNTNPVSPGSSQGGPYCCQGASGTPQSCQAGPILQTQYVTRAHRACPAAYAYAYDDKTATISCSTSSHYEVTFYCPSGNVANETITVV